MDCMAMLGEICHMVTAAAYCAANRLNFGIATGRRGQGHRLRRWPHRHVLGVGFVHFVFGVIALLLAVSRHEDVCMRWMSFDLP